MRIPDRLVVAVSVIVALIGLSALLISVSFVDPPLISVKEFGDADGAVRVEGRVEGVHSSSGVTSFTLVQECEVRAVVFANLEVEEGVVVVATGERGSFGGEEQLVVTALEEKII